MGFDYDDLEKELEKIDNMPLVSDDGFDDGFDDVFEDDNNIFGNSGKSLKDENDFDESQFAEIESDLYESENEIEIPNYNENKKPEEDFLNIDFGSNSSDSLIENVEPVIEAIVEEYHPIENPNNLPDDSLIEDISGRFSDVDYNVEPEIQYPYLKIFGVSMVEERDILVRICDKYRNENDYIDFRVDFKNKRIGYVSMNLDTLLNIRELGVVYVDKLDEDDNPIYDENGKAERVAKQRYSLRIYYDENDYNEIDLMDSDSLLNSIEIK